MKTLTAVLAGLGLLATVPARAACVARATSSSKSSRGSVTSSSWSSRATNSMSSAELTFNQ